MGKRTSNVDKIPLVLTSWYGKILTVTISVVLLAEGRLLRQVVPVMSLAEHSRRKRINRNAFKLCPAFAKAKTFSCSSVSGPECNRDTCLEWTIGETYWSTWIRQQKLRNPNLFVISEMCWWSVVSVTMTLMSIKAQLPGDVALSINPVTAAVDDDSTSIEIFFSTKFNNPI